MMEVSAEMRRRLTSVNRAREPYDAVKVTVPTQIVCGNDNAIFKLDT